MKVKKYKKQKKLILIFNLLTLIMKKSHKIFSKYKNVYKIIVICRNLNNLDFFLSWYLLFIL